MIKQLLSVISIILLLILIPLGILYLMSPSKDDISHYNDDNYYLVRVVVGSGKTTESYYGTLEKTEYSKWENGTDSTIWLVSSRDENRGYRLSCDAITTITIYDKNDRLPLTFR